MSLESIKCTGWGRKRVEVVSGNVLMWSNKNWEGGCGGANSVLNLGVVIVCIYSIPFNAWVFRRLLWSERATLKLWEPFGGDSGLCSGWLGHDSGSGSRGFPWHCIFFQVGVLQMTELCATSEVLFSGVMSHDRKGCRGHVQDRWSFVVRTSLKTKRRKLVT